MRVSIDAQKRGTMRITSIKTIFSSFAVAGLLLAIGSPMLTAQSLDSEEISKLLSTARTHAVLAEDDAATLESFTKSKLAWRTHAIKLEAMKEHVNDLGRVTKQMADLRSQGSPWQQEAIDQTTPLLRNMANHLTATINHLNDNQARVHMPPYIEYARTNRELAARTAEVIKDFVEYDEAKATADSLEHSLELPTPDAGH